jgi:Tol biopolymer transport system component
MKHTPHVLLVLALALHGLTGSTSVDAQSNGSSRQRPRDAACEVQEIARAAEGLKLWSPARDKYLTSKKDADGIYQIYVGERSDSPRCITCEARPNSPAVKRHKMQAVWHPSGRWIVLAAERDKYNKPWLATRGIVEGLLQSGIWVNMYMTRPDGSEWHRLTDFGAKQRGDGYTGVAWTPDGKRGVWAQIVDGNIFKNKFGQWELIIADFREDKRGVPSFTNLRNITPRGARWVEPGNFAPDGRSLALNADVGMANAEGQDQYILDVTTGRLRNLTNSPEVWDEHGVFSPDGEKIFFMSSSPFRGEKLAHSTLFLKTEFMLINKDGSDLQQVTHFNTPGYPESNPKGQRSVAAVGGWEDDGRSVLTLNLSKFPEYEEWTITFKGHCGNRSLRRDR